MFIILLAADSGGFETLTMLLKTERFSAFKGHGLEICTIDILNNSSKS